MKSKQKPKDSKKSPEEPIKKTDKKADGKKSVVGKREQKEPERKSTRKSIPVIEPPPKKRDKKTPAPVKEVDEEGQ